MRSCSPDLGAEEEEESWYVVAPAAARARVVRRRVVVADFRGGGGTDALGSARVVEKRDVKMTATGVVLCVYPTSPLHTRRVERASWAQRCIEAFRFGGGG
ncbi:hypothetical protein VC83_02229 [Pseudogymnoascus destructans]|uniref:Uncharacterized protein n=1 Tax=Pseudogymnoascus destructans TaxID=655981 RepID=A0A177AH04_9PEZI|nr:uncharacterized protein VC83_02229 [Pseudogymnoascus destructans]OAF61348.1 hypothetical protein VC83_02229 [Pseudogymnoascus destructans]